MFSYQMPTRIEFGVGKVRRLTEFLRELRVDGHVMVVSDTGIISAGILDPVLDDFRAAGYRASLFTQVAQNPRDTDCLAGAEAFRQAGATAIIAVGGGSAMDTAKTIAVLAAGGGAPADYADGLRAYPSPCPIVCVPTTAGTGSEVTRSAVITESATHRKMTLKHANLRPQLAVLDPNLTLSVPKAVTAATGVDALVHAIEGTTCRLSTPMSRAFGRAAMPGIVAALPRAVEDGRNLEARSTMLECSLLAGLSFGNADVAAVHCLAEALGGLYDTPHGVANAVFLPYVLRFNAQGYLALHADLARLMKFAQDTDSNEAAVAKLTDGVAWWTQTLGIPKLRDLPGVAESDFDRIVAMAEANGSTPSNVREIDALQYRGILEAAFRGQ